MCASCGFRTVKLASSVEMAEPAKTGLETLRRSTCERLHGRANAAPRASSLQENKTKGWRGEDDGYVNLTNAALTARATITMCAMGRPEIGPSERHHEIHKPHSAAGCSGGRFLPFVRNQRHLVHGQSGRARRVAALWTSGGCRRSRSALEGTVHRRRGQDERARAERRVQNAGLFAGPATGDR